jgi:hypothetical protein
MIEVYPSLQETRMRLPARSVLMAFVATLGCRTVETGGGVAAIAGPEAAEPHPCVVAQRLIGGYEAEALERVVRLTIHDGLDAFLESKPQIGSDSLSLHGFTPTPRLASSEYPQLWCKLKSARDIARSRDISLLAAGEGLNCDRINEALFAAARAADPASRGRLEASGYQLAFRNETLLTGGQWAPSVAKIKLEPGRRLVVETTSLESLPGIPRFGGMNYCKLFAPEALKELLADIEAGDFTRVVVSDEADPREIVPPGLEFGRIRYKALLGNLLSQKADVYWRRGELAGVYVISPGGGVDPLAMRGLAAAIVAKGHAVFVVHYPLDLAILERLTLRENSAYSLGLLLARQQLAELHGLPDELAAALQQRKLPLKVLGHSLGGAILGDMLFKDGGPFDQVVLYGTSSFVKTTSRSKLEVPAFYAFFGQNDGLSLETPAKVDALRQQLGVTEVVDASRYRAKDKPFYVEVVPELNHFCVISDMTAGSAKQKGRDREGPVPSRCVSALVAKMQERGLL